MDIEAFKRDHLLWIFFFFFLLQNLPLTLSPPQCFFHSFFFVLTFLFHSSVCLHQLSNYHPFATADYLVHFRKKANTGGRPSRLLVLSRVHFKGKGEWERMNPSAPK